MHNRQQRGRFSAVPRFTQIFVHAADIFRSMGVIWRNKEFSARNFTENHRGGKESSKESILVFASLVKLSYLFVL